MVLSGFEEGAPLPAAGAKVLMTLEVYGNTTGRLEHFVQRAGTPEEFFTVYASASKALLATIGPHLRPPVEP